jgi:GNAT superfamily N-acetyltransferase
MKPKAPVDAKSSLQATDLAPGDRKALDLNLDDLEFNRVTDANDALLERGYNLLRSRFKHGRDLAPIELFRRRLGWDPAAASRNYSLAYEMLVVTRDAEPVAVRDHEAVVIHEPEPEVVVHQSHLLVDPAWRRTGLAGWLRCYSAQAGRCAAVAAGYSSCIPLTLVTELEQTDPVGPDGVVALMAYEKGGYRKVDPGAINYVRPDLQSRAEGIESAGPYPLALLIRRLDKPDALTISGRRLRRIVSALYRIYSGLVAASEMAPLYASLERYPEPDDQVRLIPPTAGSSAR